jgi:hypothetical protein
MNHMNSYTSTDRFNRKRPVIPAEAGHEVKRFSAIQKVKELSWIPAFAGMTL